MPEVKEGEPKKLKPCCACPETRKVRDNCTAVIMDTRVELYAELDIGNLCASNIVDLKLDKPLPGEAGLLSLATKGAQFLLDQIFKLPSEYQGCDAVVKLPERTIALPREKPLPKPNPLTKWQQFAKKKGITKQNKDKLVWDTATKEWKPRFGYRSIKNTTSDWMVEVPNNADPNVDYFAKNKKERNEKVAKNEYQRLRNIAASSKISSLESYEEADKNQVKGSLLHARNSTASLGKFTENIRHEKPIRKPGKKSKMADLTADEKSDNLKQYEKLMNKKPKLDIEEAVNVHIAKKTKFKKPSAEGKKSNSKKKRQSFNRNKFNKKRNRK